MGDVLMRLIDADELKEKFAVPSNELFYAGTVLDYIKEAPTVDAVKVRHGKWIEGADGSVMCSECGQVIRYDIGYFCPKCGSFNGGSNETLHN